MPFKDYRQTSAYGWRTHPISGGRKFHAGIDLVKKKGGTNATIQAFTAGTVIHAKMGVSGSGVGGYGNTVIIKDSNGAAHVYAHLHSISVKNGAKVSKGQTIGKQGATGNVTGVHLHYEIRKNASPSLGWTSAMENATYNPTSYLTNNKPSKGSARVLAKLKVDGIRGNGTIRRFQQFMGTPVDGRLSRVSPAIKAWQQFLNNYGGANLKEDGIEGPATIKAGQKFFGTTADGKISKVSPYVKEFQRFLNNYGR